MIRNIICCKSEGKYTDYCNNNPDNYNCGMTGQCKPNCTIIRQLCMIVRIMGIRLGNKGGTWETSSQKQFGFAEIFCSFEVFKKLNQKNSSEISVKIIFLA